MAETKTMTATALKSTVVEGTANADGVTVTTPPAETRNRIISKAHPGRFAPIEDDHPASELKKKMATPAKAVAASQPDTAKETKANV